MFSNRLDDLFDISDKKNVISRRQNKNAISLQLPAIGKDRVAGHFEPKERIEDTKKDTSDISFFHRGMIKYN